MSKRQPKISVIIPVYNVENYILYTIESLLSQTLKDIEIILIDDGSTDNSKNIIESYIQTNSNIKLITQSNSGPSAARNKGIIEATGEYIVFVDSDDLLPQDSLEIRYNIAKENNADLVIGGTYKFDSKREWPMKNHFLGYGEKNIKQDSSILWTLGPCNKIFKSDLIKNLKFPEEIKYAEDQVFIINAYINARKIYSINDVIYYYRMRESDENTSLTQQIYTDSSNVVKQIYHVWKETCKNIDQNIENKYQANSIKANYLNRLVEADLWPALKASIVGKNEDWQKVALIYSIKMLESINEDILNTQTKLKWILSKGITDKYLFLCKKNRHLYIKQLKILFNKLDGDSINKLRLEHKYYISCIERAIRYNSSIFIYEFLIRRRIRKLKESLKLKNIKKKIDMYITKICTIYVFNLSKLLPIKNTNVVLASNRSTALEGNLKVIDSKINKDSYLNTKIYLKQNKRSKKELIKMYYNFARAKYIILDDYYKELYGYKFRKETEIIQVWHACGAFKKFGFSAIGYIDGNSEKFETRAHSHYTKVITSSKNINQHYSEAFNIDENNVLNLGVPRTDKILDLEYRDYIKEKLENEYPMIKNKRVIMYAPTFRGGPKERRNFDCKLNYKQLIEDLGDEYIIILKLHPMVDEKSVYIPDEYKDNILNMTKYKDINELLFITDILITDYSSVIFEYSLLEKPIIFFAYDLESYTKERSFYYDYKQFVPGPIVYRNEEIISLIKENKFNLDDIKTFRDRFYDSVDGKSTERLVEYMMKGKK